MSLVKAAIHAFEDAPLPDVVSRAAIDAFWSATPGAG
jgi:cyclopropane-fatty-acyl-phospholipid synthase